MVPLPVSKEGFRFLFTIIDRSSRMLEVALMVSVEIITCQGALIRNWIFCFGVPVHITSDHGAQFTSALWSCMCKVIGTHYNTTTAYHPTAD